MILVGRKKGRSPAAALAQDFGVRPEPFAAGLPSFAVGAAAGCAADEDEPLQPIAPIRLSRIAATSQARELMDSVLTVDITGASAARRHCACTGP